jgi:hypothetical protein
MEVYRGARLRLVLLLLLLLLGLVHVRVRVHPGRRTMRGLRNVCVEARQCPHGPSYGTAHRLASLPRG